MFHPRYYKNERCEQRPNSRSTTNPTSRQSGVQAQSSSTTGEPLPTTTYPTQQNRSGGNTDSSNNNSNVNRSTIGADNNNVGSMHAVQDAKFASLVETIPLEDAKRTTPDIWKGLYQSEMDCSVVDSGVLGTLQPHISRVQRFHIVSWMSEACAVLGWTCQTFFVAVHAFDYYITKVSHEILPANLGPLATGCLYVGAQLIESATDENIYTLEKFRTLCPEIGQGEAVREAQAHLLDTLQGISLTRKTPRDFLVLYLAGFAISEDKMIAQVYEQLFLGHKVLSMIFDLCSILGLVLYTSGLCLDVLASRVVACGIIRGLEIAFASVGRPFTASMKTVICEKIFHFPRGTDELEPLFTLMSEVIDACAQLVVRNGPNAKSSVNQTAVTSAESLGPSARASTPQEWTRHFHPPNFADWPMGSCTPRIVVLGQKLRESAMTRAVPSVEGNRY